MASKDILIVEDMPGWREQLADVLERRNYDVTTAATYPDALEKLQQVKPKVAIVDLRLSASDVDNRDGIDLLRDLASRDIDAFVFTGYPTREFAEQAFQTYHVREIFLKQDPEAVAKLRDAVDHVLQQKTTEQELAELRSKFISGEIVELGRSKSESDEERGNRSGNR